MMTTPGLVLETQNLRLRDIAHSIRLSGRYGNKNSFWSFYIHAVQIKAISPRFEHRILSYGHDNIRDLLFCRRLGFQIDTCTNTLYQLARIGFSVCLTCTRHRDTFEQTARTSLQPTLVIAMSATAEAVCKG
jgi:hypothetical protein